MENLSLNNLTKKAYQNALSAGWWDNEREFGTILMLIVSEAAEALEADRTGTKLDISKDRLSQIIAMDSVEDFRLAFKENVKDTIEDELADIVIRVMDYCGRKDIDLESHVVGKMRYNNTRGYKHGGKNY